MDIFCQAQTKLAAQIIHHTDHFLVLHDGFPLAEGHLFMIPKKHYSCMAEVYENEDLKQEAKQLCRRLINFLTQYYTDPVLFEHGNLAQTIIHAHLHFLPTRVSLIKELNRFHRIPVPTKPYAYLYYEENSKPGYYVPSEPIANGFLHSTYAGLLGRPAHGPDRQKEFIQWLVSVKANWRKFLTKEG